MFAPLAYSGFPTLSIQTTFACQIIHSSTPSVTTVYLTTT